MATTLHWAVQAGDLEGVRALLDEGLDVNVGDRLERTPLFHAASRCHAEIVEVLLRRGRILTPPTWEA
jgi:ankyrin repeat protein